MPETTTLVNAQPKNVVASKTIWGGIIMLLSALSPMLSTWLGIDLTADDINRGVSLAAELFQAGGAAVGFVLMVWSRFQRRSQPLVMGSTKQGVQVEVPKSSTK